MTIINHDPLEGVTYVGNTVGWGGEMELVESGCESWLRIKSPASEGEIAQYYSALKLQG